MSEQIFYFKDACLYKVISGGLHEVPIEGAEYIDDKSSLLIDDSYFFYTSMDNVSVTGKKLHAIVGNYLSTMFPSDLLDNYGVTYVNNTTLIYIVSDELARLIEEYPQLFSKPKKISTPYIEMVSSNTDFNYCDGFKVYKKQNSEIILSQDKDDCITSKDYFADYGTFVMNSIALKGVKKTTIFDKSKYIAPAIALAAVYIIFIIGGVFSVMSAARINQEYTDTLNNMYESNGITNTPDPYGLLLFRASDDGETENMRVLEVLKSLEAIKDISNMSVLSVRDKDIRVEGVAADFAQIDEIKQKMADTLNREVSISDTNVVNNGVSFVMRYEY